MALNRRDRFMRRAARRIANVAYRRVQPRVSAASTTLGRDLKIYVNAPRAGSIRAGLAIDYYWALYVHEGRRPFGKRRYMVFFRNKALDPRLQRGVSPRRKSQLRRFRNLSRAQYERALELNRLHRRAGGSDATRPVVFTKKIAKPTPPNRFFSNNGPLRGLDKDANRVVKPEFDAYVDRLLGRDLSRKEPLSLVIDTGGLRF